MITKYELKKNLPFEIKEKMAKQRIREWYDYWRGRVYISFSGGKDSTVLLHLVRSLYYDVPAVFCNTGQEFPEIIKFVKTFDNITWIKPQKSFKEIINNYGYPIISKEVSQKIYEYRRTKSEKVKFNLTIPHKTKNLKDKIVLSFKWHKLLKTNFKISDKCCHFLKKQPFYLYEKETDNKAILGIRAKESRMRLYNYNKNGCNAFGKRPISAPLSVWNDDDIAKYIEKHNIQICNIYNNYSRTGCMGCGFGVHLEKQPNRFQLLERTHPIHWNYFINYLGYRELFEFLNIPYRNELTLFENIEIKK